MLVQDTKKPNREPFETSDAGFKDLQKRFGNRYKALQKVTVTPEAIKVTQREIVPPAKTTKGK